MSGKLSSTLTGSMESINVQEACTEISCDEDDTENQPTARQMDMETTASTSTKTTTTSKRKCRSDDHNGHAGNARENRVKETEDRKGDKKKDGEVASKPSPVYFVKDWEFVQTLGEGAYGEVKLAYNSKTQEAVAVKVINTRGQGQAALDDVRKEVCIHRMIHHKNVIGFYGVRKEGDIQYLFLQYASGGELFDRIEPDVGMPQAEAQRYFRQLIDGLEYLHNKGIAHRDIKPENLLLDDKDNLKIADFGLATVFRHQGKWRYLDRLCGSAPYLAPELISSNPYRAEPADLWSSGVVLVALLGGELPWDAAVMVCTDYMNWRECHIENRPWNKIDNLALCLLRRLLMHKPEKRYTIDQIRKNQWFKKDFSTDTAQQLSAGPKRRRRLGSQSEHSPGGVSCSQPTLTSTSGESNSPRCPLNKSETGSPCTAQGHGHGDGQGHISFSQPAQSDDMLLSSQLNSTQSSQTPLQKLVRRMTRFFCTAGRSEVKTELCDVFAQLGYTWKHSTSNVLTVHTSDRRQGQLTFKTMIVEMGDNLLVDFRLSRGDGLEFKRQFMKVRDLMKSVICQVPSSWPNLPNL